MDVPMCIVCGKTKKTFICSRCNSVYVCGTKHKGKHMMECVISYQPKMTWPKISQFVFRFIDIIQAYFAKNKNCLFILELDQNDPSSACPDISALSIDRFSTLSDEEKLSMGSFHIEKSFKYAQAHPHDCLLLYVDRVLILPNCLSITTLEEISIEGVRQSCLLMEIEKKE